MELGLKTYYGVSATVFVVSFAVTLALIEFMKPEWASEQKKPEEPPKTPEEPPKKPEEIIESYYRSSYRSGMNGDKKDRVVRHGFAVMYSIVIALIISILYGIIANAAMKNSDKLDPMVHTSLVIIGVFLISRLVFFFYKPGFIMDKDKDGKMKVNMMKENMFAVIFAVIGGIVSHMIYRKSGKRSAYIAGPEFGSRHYKMSYPMKH